MSDDRSINTFIVSLDERALFDSVFPWKHAPRNLVFQFNHSNLAKLQSNKPVPLEFSDESRQSWKRTKPQLLGTKYCILCEGGWSIGQKIGEKMLSYIY